MKLFDWVQKLYLKEFLGKNFEEDFSSREDFYKEDDTIVYEYKTGPYKGQENDKVFIGDDRE